MCRRRWNYLNMLINNKMKGIQIEEEEIELKAEEARKDKSIWYPTIWKKIQENKLERSFCENTTPLSAKNYENVCRRYTKT